LTGSNDRGQPDDSQQHERSDDHREHPFDLSNSTSRTQKPGDGVDRSSSDLILLATETLKNDAKDEVDAGAGNRISDAESSDDSENAGKPFTIDNSKAAAAFGEVVYFRRHKRDQMFGHFNARNCFRSYRDDKIIMLNLPCHDDHYRGLKIPLPAEDHDALQNHGKPALKCRMCREWYNNKDMHDHVLVCKAFFEYAIYCAGCDRIFNNNTAYKQQHSPMCSPPVVQPRSQQNGQTST
jgi:hypothetical protein